ncbi:MAG: hypothetical protein KAS64_09365 [Spirochaetes bacterium]|nr:hypothetical protein [Spirochaetota bacterium]
MGFSEFNLYCNLRNEFRKISIVENPQSEYIDFVQQNWNPILVEQHKRAISAYCLLPENKKGQGVWQQKLGLYGVPDSHWDWAYKSNKKTNSNKIIWGLLDEESVEALMSIYPTQLIKKDTSAITA